MNLALATLAFVDATEPVRLMTADGPAVVESGTSLPLVSWIAIGLGVAIVCAVVGVRVWQRRPTRSAAMLDRQAAQALAKKMGLSRRDTAVVFELAKADGQVSALDLLVSVKKLQMAATRRGPLANEQERARIEELCKALDVELLAVPAAPAKSNTPAKAGSKRYSAPGRPSKVPTVVSPRLIDRRG